MLEDPSSNLKKVNKAAFAVTFFKKLKHEEVDDEGPIEDYSPGRSSRSPITSPKSIVKVMS